MLDALKEKLSRTITQTAEAILATEQEQEERLAICRSCDKLKRMDFCSMCGCFMPAKTKLANQSCPLKKWIPIERS